MDINATARAFFDAFVQAFETFDGRVIARRYAAPYLALRADGSSELFTTADDIAGFFQRVVDRYHADGARSCRYEALEVLPVGGAHLLATVTWTLHDAAGATLSAWREAYVLACRDGVYRIASSIDH